LAVIKYELRRLKIKRPNECVKFQPDIITWLWK
jgi:hypothetical protein